MRSLLIISLLALGTIPLQATPAVSAIVNGSGLGEGGSPGSMRGWRFNVVAGGGIWVTALGVFDFDADGLVTAHPVGLWDNSGSLLASATVLAGTGSPLDVNNQFRLASISSVFLAPGTYTIGAYFAGGSDVFFRDSNVTSQTFDPAITYDSLRAAIAVSSLTFPTETFSLFGGYYGPSFELSLTPDLDTPEPATGILLTAGLGLLLLRRQRQV
ncbi:MAG: PEP-CTERM sorting domain-containing protein [Acidobacteria bacterium]|nr:PEP-CTERM sorting domain-containing protein [Acidobacteriota bacterium]